MRAKLRIHSRTISVLATASIALSVLIAACTGIHRTKINESSDLTRPEVQRISRKRVEIRWPASFTTGPVLIYAGATPESIDHSAPLAQKTGGVVNLTTAAHPRIEASHRLYYELVAVDSGASIVTAERKLPLDGADNFRDLGGYPTTDDRYVRWGILFRSNDLADFTNDDLDYLSEINIRLQCDLRSESERERRPNRALRAPAPEILEYPIHQLSMNPDEIQEAIRTGTIAAIGIRQTMLSVYRSFPTKHRDRWASIFDRLEDPQSLPFLVHCTAGKDRTGFISALLLLALGVPEQIVYEDYMATNTYRASYNNMILRWAPLYSLFRTSKEDLLPLLDARMEYLEASFQEINERWGSVDVYLEEALGLTPERLETLRANLLTPSPLRSTHAVALIDQVSSSGRMTLDQKPSANLGTAARSAEF